MVPGRNAGLAFLLTLFRLLASEFPQWDFRHGDATSGWSALHDCRLAPWNPTNGLVAEITGDDPYLAGPPLSLDPTQPLWLEMELKSNTGGSAQIFYFNSQGPSEDRSVRFAVPPARWFSARVPLPALGSDSRLRFDPPGTRGQCEIRSLRLAPRDLLKAPDWPKPVPTRIQPDGPTVKSGELELRLGYRWGEWMARIAGRDMAIGPTRSLVGYQTSGSTRWFPLEGDATMEPSGDGIVLTCRRTDPDGAHWDFHQTLRPSQRSGAIEIESRVGVDRDRSVVFLPLFTLFPGAGSFGTNKTQALFAGVEYLGNEPSSSERDLIGPQARRQVPDTLKLTFPLMSLSSGDRWIALSWDPSRSFSALFDSPDRIFQSGGSVLSVQFPGSNPAQREEGSLLPYAGELLKAGEPLVLRATLLGGHGSTIVPSVQEYVARRGLPPLPNPGRTAVDFFRLESHGWLDSAIRSGNRYRHAVGPNFIAQPASDAAVTLTWLASHVDDPDLAVRLTEVAGGAIAEVPASNRLGFQLGHIALPLGPLVFGAVEENAATALEDGRKLVARFQPDGSFPCPFP